MENRNCQHCGNEFQINSNMPGHEQKYCSKSCRSKAANERRLMKIKSDIINETKAKALPNPEGYAENLYGVQRENIRTPYRIGTITDNHLETIKELYEAKNENNFYKLKIEQLEKENSQLKIELIEYENEESDENEENDNGWLSGVEKTLPTLVKSYREDPEATMGFVGSSVNMLFNSIFKSKANASSTTTR